VPAGTVEDQQSDGAEADAVGVISTVDMLPAPRINDVLHRVTFAAVWESPQESGSRAGGIMAPGAPSGGQTRLI
jgi:hypothetical protein